ncbi:hypothetical protein AY601_4426 [Pedobacter cryoconitis]|uniref:Lanthionine synthetase-like protein n=1 Tax=Pedobacter cryoconitis TaxID=188932 RepID=A0A127VIX0_9SPHI|nr:lanthionine synthetase LanC family protein [Pedobacter cryoconitis]AMQ01267.1 hypothetical protein AY601_4426 [Pedobacter cryoconitis]
MKYELAKEKLKQIAKELKDEKYLNSPNLGVLNGISGIALFLFHYYKYSGDEYYSDLGKKYIVEIIDRINNGYSFPTYCSGIAGAAWTIEYLNEYNFIQFSSDENFNEIDEFLAENMNSCMKKGQFDFLHCSIGYGYYFLKRYNLTNSKRLKQKYLNYIHDLIDGLSAFSFKSQNGIYWINTFEGFPKNSVDTGFAHGMSGIISFLTNVLSYNIKSPKALKMLDLATNFLLTARNDQLDSAYPKNIYINLIDPHLAEASRMAWCYGDLGIASAFMNASRFIKGQDLLKESERIMIKCCSRRSLLETGVVDSGLCHGSLGIAVIYKSFYDITSNKNFSQASNYWLNDGLMKGSFPDGLGGFKKYDYNKYINEVNLLDGIAGIGLGIISLISDTELNWKQSMMI